MTSKFPCSTMPKMSWSKEKLRIVFRGLSAPSIGEINPCWSKHCLKVSSELLKLFNFRIHSKPNIRQAEQTSLVNSSHKSISILTIPSERNMTTINLNSSNLNQVQQAIFQNDTGLTGWRLKLSGKFSVFVFAIRAFTAVKLKCSQYNECLRQMIGH